MSEEQKHQAQRSRNTALGLVLAGLVILFYGLAIVRVGG